MYVNVHVKVKDYEKLKKLFLSALVTEFDPKTGVHYESGNLKLKLYFEEKSHPKESIRAFCECGEILYLDYNYPSDEFSEESIKNNSSVIVPSLDESSKAASEDSSNMQTATTSATTDKVAQKNSDKRPMLVEIPELEAMSKDASSVDEYLKKVATFLEIPEKQQTAFQELVKIYPQLSKPTWEHILPALAEKGIKCNTYDKKLMIDAVTAKVGFPFLKVVRTVINTINAQEISTGNVVVATDDNSSSAHNGDQVSETSPEANNVDVEVAIEAENKIGNTDDDESEKLFTCMPDVAREAKEEISKIEASLKAIDKALPMSEKIRQAIMIFVSNNISNLGSDPSSLETFIQFSQRAVGEHEVTFDSSVVNPGNIIPENTIRAQILNWSLISKNLTGLYDPSCESSHAKSIDFLRQLREILI